MAQEEALLPLNLEDETEVFLAFPLPYVSG